MKKILFGFLSLAGVLTFMLPVVEVGAFVGNTETIFFRNTEKATFLGGLFRDFVPGAEGPVMSTGAGARGLQLSGAEQARAIADIVRKYVYGFLIPITVILSVYAGMQLIFSRGKEETYKEKKEQILSYLYGFGVMLLSVVLVDNIFFGKTGDLLITTGDPAADSIRIAQYAERGYTEFQGIFNYIVTFAVVVAVGFLIHGAIKMITSTTNAEAEQKKFRQSVMYILLGMVVLVSAQKIVDLLTDNKSEIAQLVTKDSHVLQVPDPSGIVNFFVDWLNFLLGTIGVISVIAMVYAGIQLIANMGTDGSAKDKAIKILKASIIGLIVAFSSWTIVYYFLVPGGQSDVQYLRPRERCSDLTNPDCKLNPDGTLNQARSEKAKRQ